jgi:hypothetical protein
VDILWIVSRRGLDPGSDLRKLCTQQVDEKFPTGVSSELER